MVKVGTKSTWLVWLGHLAAQKLLEKQEWVGEKQPGSVAETSLGNAAVSVKNTHGTLAKMPLENTAICR